MIGTDADDATTMDQIFSSDRQRDAEQPEADADHAPEQEALPPEPDDDQSLSEDAPRDPETGRFLPIAEHIKERKKWQSKNDDLIRAREQAEERARHYETLVAQYQQPARQPQAQSVPEEPDWWTDPESASANMQRTLETQIQAQIYQTRVALGQEMLRARHNDYDEAESAFVAAADANPALQQAVLRHPNPAGYAYEVGKQMLAMSKIGPDISAYEERVRKEERERVLAELKGGSVASKQKFPGTLADASAAGSQGAHLSEEAAMQSVFGSERQNRGRG